MYVKRKCNFTRDGCNIFLGRKPLAAIDIVFCWYIRRVFFVRCIIFNNPGYNSKGSFPAFFWLASSFKKTAQWLPDIKIDPSTRAVGETTFSVFVGFKNGIFSGCQLLSSQRWVLCRFCSWVGEFSQNGEAIWCWIWRNIQILSIHIRMRSTYMNVLVLWMCFGGTFPCHWSLNLCIYKCIYI